MQIMTKGLQPMDKCKYCGVENVTRVELIDGSGRVYVNMNVADVILSLQDNKRTLKIFVEDAKDES